MLEKIIHIKNVGTFVDFVPNQTKYNWDGKLGRINIIYASNGSGKTTLSTLLSSVSTEMHDLIKLKHSFNQTGKPSIKLYTNSVGLIEFQDDAWSKKLVKAEIFSIHFIEDYLFSSSTSTEKNSDNLLKLLLGEYGVQLKNKYKRLRKKKDAIENHLKRTKNEKKPSIKNLTDIILKLDANKIAIENTISDFNEYANPIFEKYITTTNLILSKFSTNIRVSGLVNPTPFFEAEKLAPAFYISIDNKILRFKSPDLSKKIGTAKYSLSEGDKNAIALSFYLAHIEILGLNDKIIIIDDPLSSFDYQRKRSTINILSSLASQCEQFFLLTHDIHFANDLSNKLNFTEVLNLKIEKIKDTSIITIHDISLETASGYKKDIQTIKEYQTKKHSSENDKREVIRCFRPILETIFKTKYFEYIKESDWLGDIIGKIRNSDYQKPLSKLEVILPDLIAINDYSKTLHHSEINNDIINSQELDYYIDLLKNTILKI